MIQCQIKLKPTRAQEATLLGWLPTLTSIWNWAIRKIERDADVGIRYAPNRFKNVLAGTSVKVDVPSHTIQGVLEQASVSWRRCVKGVSKKPKMKGRRNTLNSIPFPDPIRVPTDNRIRMQGVGFIKYHKQRIPQGKIKSARIVRRASGWYACLFIEANPSEIIVTGNAAVGIDPGYETLLTFSTGEKVAHPRELQESVQRLGQAQRGKNRKLVARIHERINNKRKDRNHKLSSRIVSENAVICFSKDNLRGLSRCGFGKSVASASHGQLRSMLSYKCSRTGGREYIEVPSKGSTRTCSHCGSVCGPKGKQGLSVRVWECTACGTQHDRDVNAAINTLISGVGATHERTRHVA